MTQPPAPRIPLRCPVCAAVLERAGDAGRTLACVAGHRFDAARQGYFNLLVGKGTAFREDTGDMVAARADFLAAGHYAPLADAVAAEAGRGIGARPGNGARVLDAGAGTGYYLERILASLGAATGQPAAAVALDISRHAMRRAAKLPGTTALVWDLWRPLPLDDAGVDVLLNVFAPRNGPEYRRVLAPGGVAVVVTPLPEHLAEASELLGLLAIAPGKEETVAASLGDGFEPLGTREVRAALRLSEADAVRLAVMGPAGHHLDAHALRGRVEAAPPPVAVTAAFRVQTFRRI
ncbi:putative RNA methyltransferase [Arthrobacter halodurans]|uniref:RNA methyltransferase n=1 Tax=Arthrobacter halodurans TaxID=516699 RepID=A0ABV4UKW6_9MICC